MTATDALVEAEAFDDYGGWVLDSQFELEMGSPYLLAHGNGVPVQDARTVFTATEAGTYNVWVRAKDWVPGHHPGRFTLGINGKVLDTVFGSSDKDWSWESGGQVELTKGQTALVLHDLTGFCARCDAIFFSTKDTPPPEGAGDDARAWRKRLLGLPISPLDVGHFDVIVLGGGIVGSAAALTAARLGERVALVHNRPYLGGNASVEIGLRPRGVTGPLIDEISERSPDGDIVAKQFLDAERSASVFLEYTIYNATIQQSNLISVDAREARTGREIRFKAPVFIDCSGRALLGELGNAETLCGQESRSEYGESLAPEIRVESHHGHTLFFRTGEAPAPVPFPPVPWAVEVAKDYADLGGQLARPGIENAPGPVAASTNHKLRKRMTRPLTHFWEYGQYLDPYEEGERIRDHLLRAVYGTFSNVKNLDREKFANLHFEHVAFVAAQGEFKRYKGAYVLSENDIRDHNVFPDAVAKNGGAFCLHYAPEHDAELDFRLKYWEWDERDSMDYDIPFRSLYSVNMGNLMMAGKHISVTHIAGSNTKFMGNGGQHAIATAVAAHLCRRYQLLPKEVGDQHIQELRSIARRIAEENCFPSKTTPRARSRL